MQLEEVLEKLKGRGTPGPAPNIGAILTELELEALEVDKWPDSFVQGLFRLLGDPEFHQLNDSWKLLYFVGSNWDKFPPEDCDDLRQILVTSFDSYSDTMGAFTTAEILGEHFTDRQTLDVFADLARHAIPPTNALVPHGLETFVRATTDVALREHAMNQLRLLTQDGSSQMGQEAAECIRRLQKKL